MEPLNFQAIFIFSINLTPTPYAYVQGLWYSSSVKKFDIIV